MESFKKPQRWVLLLTFLLASAAVGAVATAAGREVVDVPSGVESDQRATDGGQGGTGTDEGQDETEPNPDDDDHGCFGMYISLGCRATGTGVQAPIPGVFALFALAAWARRSSRRFKGSRRNSQ